MVVNTLRVTLKQITGKRTLPEKGIIRFLGRQVSWLTMVECKKNLTPVFHHLPNAKASVACKKKNPSFTVAGAATALVPDGYAIPCSLVKPLTISGFGHLQDNDGTGAE